LVTDQVAVVALAYCTDQPVRFTAVLPALKISMKSLRKGAPELPPPPKTWLMTIFELVTGEGEGVGDGEGLGDGDGDGDGVGVGVGVAVGDGLGVGETDGDGVGVGIGLGDGDGDGLGVGVGPGGVMAL